MAKKKEMASKYKKLFAPIEKNQAYEMVVIVKPYLPEHIRKKAEKKIEDILKKYDVVLKGKAYWGKRVLAYKIAGHKEGYYIIYHFEAPTKNISSVRKYLDKHPELLRYMILQLEDASFDKLNLLVKKAVVME